MRIEFDEGGHIEMSKSKNGYFITIGAPAEERQTIINSVEISYEQLENLLKSVKFSTKTSKKKTKKKAVESDKKTAKSKTSKKSKESKNES